jgi:hypothetical protein
MELSSVRALKAEMFAGAMPMALEAIHARGVAARAWALAEANTPRALALGVSPKPGGGYRLAVRLQQRALESSAVLQRIVKAAKNEVDVRYVGRVGKRATPWYQAKQHPLLTGCSVGHFGITAGTLGGFVQPVGGGNLCLLSNNHVLANENKAKKGDNILQQARDDGGVDPDDAVAWLLPFPRLKRSSKNYVDCAMAELYEGVEANTSKLTGIGKLRGLGPEFLVKGEAVSKLGRTTGLTHGKVTAFELDGIAVDYDIGRVTFDNQIEIEGAGKDPFSEGGDSGSLIVNSDKLAVALLFAGGDQGGSNGKGLTYANPIHVVLNSLKAELVV